jgi:hypothetical protein
LSGWARFNAGADGAAAVAGCAAPVEITQGRDLAVAEGADAQDQHYADDVEGADLSADRYMSKASVDRNAAFSVVRAQPSQPPRKRQDHHHDEHQNDDRQRTGWRTRNGHANELGDLEPDLQIRWTA